MDGKYQWIGDGAYSAQELLKKGEFSGYGKNLVVAEKSVHEKVIYESDTEGRFADDLGQNAAGRLYAKLLCWFEMATPVGSYNADPAGANGFVRHRHSVAGLSEGVAVREGERRCAVNADGDRRGRGGE